MLSLRGVEACYGSSQALFGVDFDIVEGEVATLLGRNGMGKTTTVRAIMGLLPVSAGEIVFDGTALHTLEPHRIARCGLGLVPEGRQVFPNLTAEENLLATARAGKWDLAAVYALFPRLAERARHMGNQLSGGEQQMLVIGRALMTNPKLLILDEATEGLAPLVREEIWQVLAQLKAEGESILLIDKNLDALLALADRHLIMEKGRVVWQGDSAELGGNRRLQSRYLGV